MKVCCRRESNRGFLAFRSSNSHSPIVRTLAPSTALPWCDLGSHSDPLHTIWVGVCEEILLFTIIGRSANITICNTRSLPASRLHPMTHLYACVLGRSLHGDEHHYGGHLYACSRWHHVDSAVVLCLYVRLEFPKQFLQAGNLYYPPDQKEE